MDKKALSERDICSKFITPAIQQAGWDDATQVREEVRFTKGRIIVRGKMVSRGKAKRADYILYYKPNIPIAVIEAKDNTLSIGSGIQQALEYAETLDIPFAFSSNGDGFAFYDGTGLGAEKEATLALDAGYVTVTPDLKFEVSRRIKEEFDNGRHYYALHGQTIAPPSDLRQCPDPVALTWHNEQCFRG